MPRTLLTQSNDMLYFHENTWGQWTNVTPAVPANTVSVTMSMWMALGRDSINSANSTPLIGYGYHYMYIRNTAGNNNTVRIRNDETAAHEAGSADIGNGNRALHHVVGIYEYTGGANATISIYVDNVKVSSTQTVLPTTVRNPVGGTLGRLSNTGVGTNLGYIGKIQDVRIYHSALSDADVTTLYNNGILGTAAITPDIWFKLNEKTGTAMLDSSGNANHGTMMNPRWPVIDFHNLIANGNMELAPPFVAATNTATKGVDGTAIGDGNELAFRWRTTSIAGSAAAQFDSSTKNSGSNSIKVSTLTAGSNLGLTSSAGNTKYQMIPVRPSTLLKVYGYLKTNYISGGGRGAYLRITQRSSNGGTISALADTTYINVTSDWTYFEASATSAPTAYYVYIELDVTGTTLTADLIMDAWFDDVGLIMNNQAKELATRTLASSRVLIS
jgi:hypothetical protein